MAVEKERGCGYREVHGLYITSGPMSFACDRLPIPTNLCSCCGNFIREFQGVQAFDPVKLLGSHGKIWENTDGSKQRENPHTQTITDECSDPSSCFACFPYQAYDDTKDFMMWVGRSYYTIDSFSKEAALMGVSKRIAANGIPIGMVAGRSWIFLAMRNIMEADVVEIDGTKRRAHGIFMVFKIQKLEFLIWKSEATPEYIKQLEGHGLTPVIIPDGDEDHAPKKKKRGANPFALKQAKKDALDEPDPNQQTLDGFMEEEIT